MVLDQMLSVVIFNECQECGRIIKVNYRKIFFSRYLKNLNFHFQTGIFHCCQVKQIDLKVGKHQSNLCSFLIDIKNIFTTWLQIFNANMNLNLNWYKNRSRVYGVRLGCLNKMDICQWEQKICYSEENFSYYTELHHLRDIPSW